MIYILAGIAKSGKTFVANEIVKRKRVRVFSTDYIMMMLHHGNKDLNIDIDATDSEVAASLEPYIAGMIQTMIENNVTYVLEGVHFNTDFCKMLFDKYPGKIRIIYLGYKDAEYKTKGMELMNYKDATENPWFLKFKDEKLDELMKYLINESLRVSKECIRYGLEYIEVTNIVEQTDEIIHKLFQWKRSRFCSFLVGVIV